MKKNIKTLSAHKVLSFLLLCGLAGAGVKQANAQSWTKRDIKKLDKKYSSYTYVYKYLNVVVSVDTNAIVVKDLNDSKERTLQLNDKAIYLETGRLYQGDSRKNYKSIPTKNVKDILYPGDTVAVQMDTWWTHLEMKDIYEKTTQVPMAWSDDPKKVVTLYVPTLGILLKNKDANNESVKALRLAEQRQR